MTTVFWPSILFMGVAALALACILAYASKKFHVQRDSRIERILATLPSANCGVCGYPGCSGYAEGIVLAGAPIVSCSAGGEKVAQAIAEIMGTDAGHVEPRMAVVHCKGGKAEAKNKFQYQGLEDCRAANLFAGGDKTCQWGCLGLGTCVRVCAFDAIHVNTNGVAEVDAEKCTGCGKCVEVCPKQIIDQIPSSAKIFLACSNHELGAKVKQYCTVGCTACTLCVKATPSGAIEMRDHLPVLDYGKEENFVAAAYKCPQKCYTDLAKKRPKVSIDHRCNGCTECAKTCPVHGAIEGKSGEQHKVIFEKCIGCGRCISVCPVRAINLMGALGYVKKRTETFSLR